MTTGRFGTHHEGRSSAMHDMNASMCGAVQFAEKHLSVMSRVM